MDKTGGLVNKLFPFMNKEDKPDEGVSSKSGTVFKQRRGRETKLPSEPIIE